MKILKYIIFLSILIGIFFVIYRQSDKRGFRRWRISFKIAVLFAASAAGLIPINIDAMEPPGNNNQIYQERLLSDQKFNSFENNDQKVVLAKSEGGPNSGSSRGKKPLTGFEAFSCFSSLDLQLRFRKAPKIRGEAPGAAKGNGETHRPKRHRSKSEKPDYRSGYQKDEKKSPKKNAVNINTDLKHKNVKKCADTAFNDQKMKNHYEVILKRLK